VTAQPHPVLPNFWWMGQIGALALAAMLLAQPVAASGHRANILNPNFTHVGIGVAKSATSLTATQLFIPR
jgi:hypothetical protein